MKEPARILLVEDQPIARLALHTVIDSHSELSVVAETGRGDEAVVLYREHRPDVTIMDLRLPGMNGIEAIAAIRKQFPDARILVLSNYEGSEDVHQALRAGAAGYLTKDAGKDELIRAILTVHAGKRYLGSSAGTVLSERQPGSDLTERELDVLKSMVRGRSNRGIADELGISENTVRIHVAHILQKLGAEDRTQAVVIAIQRGFVHLS